MSSFVSRCNVVKLLKLPISDGMLPLMLQADKYSTSIAFERFPIEIGRTPLRGFSDRINFLKSLQFVEEVRKPSSSEPKDTAVKLFAPKLSHWRYLKLPSELGMKPENKL